MRRLQILRGQLQYKPELKDGEFFLDKTNHSLLIGDASVADGQFELAKQSSITNLQQQVGTKITNPSTKSNGQVLTYESSKDEWVAKNIPEVDIPVTSVNSKTGAVVLTAADVGALPDTTSIPTKTSEIENDSGFITSAQAPVQSVDGATGAVTTNAVKYTEQTLTDDQKTQARTNIGAGTSSFSGSYNDLSNKPTIPSTAADVGAVPTTRTVNGKALSADITLSASDVGALPDTTVIPTVPVYSLTKDATSADYAAVYHLTKDNINVGEPINIPKDLFVESGEIVDNPTGQPEGKYIKLVLQNQTEPIYINVADLVDAYTAGNGITISNTNVISANVSAGNGLSVDADGIKMGAASGTSAGAMSSDDFTKLSGIETGAQKNTVTSVNGKTGAVTITVPTKVTDLTDAADYATVTSVNAVADDVEMLNSEVGTLTTDVDALKTNITSKQNTITGGASTITDDNLTANRALVSNGSGKVAVSDVTAIELGYLDGVTSNIQTQIDGLDDSVLLGTVEGSETITMPATASWRFSYGNGKFVAVGAGVTYSSDGIIWSTPVEAPIGGSKSEAVYGEDKFVVISAPALTMYSNDGITWEKGGNLPTTYGAAYATTVAYGDGTFVAIGVPYGYSHVNAAFSHDGINWISNGNTTLSSHNWSQLVYGNGTFVAVATGTSIAAYSTNGGSTWNDTSLPSSGTWASVAYGNGKFVAITMGSNVAAYSLDGITWVETTLPKSINWSSVTYGNDRFAAVSTSDSIYAAYSLDGINWTLSNTPSGYWTSVAYGNNKFIAGGGNSNQLMYSTDGITWSNKSTSTILTSITGTDITSSVYSALEPYIPTPTVPTKTSELTNDSGFITASTAPVTSVNTKTGAVTLTASDVGALPDTTTIPTKTSELTNDSGYITQTDGDGRYLEIDGSNAPSDLTMSNTGLVVSGITTNNITVNSGHASLAGFNSFGTIQIRDAAAVRDATKYLDISSEKFQFIDINNGMIIEGLADIPSSTYVNYGSRAANKNYVDQYAPHATLVTLTVAGWNSASKTQTVTVSGILADESAQLIIPMPATASMTAYNDAGIQCTGQAANSLTFTAETVPTAAISVYVTYQAVIS